MKKSAWILGILIITFIGYVAATPFFTVSNIKTAIVEKDSEKLSENVDFPIFRKNLKKQFNTAMMKKVGAEFQNSPLALLQLLLDSPQIWSMESLILSSHQVV